MCYARRQRSSWARIKLSNILYIFRSRGQILVWAIYSSFFYFFELCTLCFDRSVFRTCFFALYFYLLLFNCQVSICSFAHSRAESSSIISLSVLLVKGFLKIFLNFFNRFPNFKPVAFLATTLLLYHVSFALSIPFSKFLQKIFPMPRPLSAPLWCSFVILSLFHAFVKNFLRFFPFLVNLP